MRFLLFSALIAAAALTAHAQPAAADSTVDAIAPYLHETTFVVVRVDLDGLAFPPAALLELSPPDAKELVARHLEQTSATISRAIQASGGGPAFFVAGIPTHPGDLPWALVLPHATPEAAAKSQAALSELQPSLPLLRGQQLAVDGSSVVVAANIEEARRPRLAGAASAAATRAFAEAADSVGAFPVRCLVVPPEHVWRSVRELMPTLPSQLGGGASEVLTDGVRWIGVGVDPATLKMELAIRSADERAAQRLADYLPRLVGALAESAPESQRPLVRQLAAALLRDVKPEIEGAQTRIRLDVRAMAVTQFLLSLASTFEKQVQHQDAVGKLRQIMLAIHNYHDAQRSFPPSAKQRDAEGRPRLSWRVHLLPYLEQTALYNQFHLDEPWDSPHNKKLAETMPAVFAAESLLPSDVKLRPGHTTFLAPVGEGTIFGGAKPVTFSQITDGTSNTVAVVVVKPERAVPWTAPDDYAFDPQDPLQGVDQDSQGQWLAAFGDGSVQRLPAGIAAELVRYLFQMADGHPVSW